MENSNNENNSKEKNPESEEKPKEEEKETKDDTGPISPEDLQTPEVKDNEENTISNKPEEEKKEEKKEEYNEILSEFDKIFKQIESKDSDKSLFNLCDKLKNKYKEKLIKDRIPPEKEQILIQNLNQIYNNYSSNEEYKKIFIEFLFNLYELWPYFYHPEEFELEIQLEGFSDPLNENNYKSLTLLDLFTAIKPKKESDMNNLIDKIIMYIYNNYTDYKSLYIENNLIISLQSRSVYVSFKIICLFLFLYKQLTLNNNVNINLYIESISSVAKILLQEASYYNQKFNNEYFENAFADFDFNSDDKVKRKLSNEEFKFLTKYLFRFLSEIILT